MLTAFSHFFSKIQAYVFLFRAGIHQHIEELLITQSCKQRACLEGHWVTIDVKTADTHCQVTLNKALSADSDLEEVFEGHNGKRADHSSDV